MIDLPVVASWASLKIGSIQIVHRDPEGNPIEQPCRIVARRSRSDYNRQWPLTVKAAGRFFYAVETD